jgi:CHAT domain-containing protein
MIVSDGVIHGLPWAVLTDPHVHEPVRGTRRLVHGASVTTARRLDARHHRQVPTRDLLLLANPLYTPEQIDDEAARCLDHTLRELEALQTVIDDVESLTDAEATEANLLERAPSFRRLHLACHRAPDPRDPLFSGLLLAEPAPAVAQLTRQPLKRAAGPREAVALARRSAG